MTYIDFLVLIIQQWFVIISLVMKSCLKHTGLRSVNIVIPNDGTLEKWKNERYLGFPKHWSLWKIFFSVFFDSSDIYSRYQNFPEHKTSKVGFLVVSLKNHRHELK